MSIPRIIAIGASAGGVEPLLRVTRALPRDFPAPVCVVLHVPPHSTSVLPRLISRAQGLPAAAGVDGEAVVPGRIYVAPPDFHMLVRFGRIRLSKGPTENGSRPAIDPLFRSIAHAYGPGAIGVVLSGALDDGTAGLYAIKAAGGIAIAQDPDEAQYPSMPSSAIANIGVDHVASSEALAGLLARLVAEPLSVDSARSPGAHAKEAAIETEIADHGSGEDDPSETALGAPSGFACPDCAGVLWEIRDEQLTRYRCRVGHAYLPESLAAAQSAKLEEALWVALRSLRESGDLARRLAERAAAGDMPMASAVYERRAQEAQERARVIKAVLKKGKLVADDRKT